LARVDFFYFNNPGNPTGRVFNGEEVSKLSELCRRHEVCLISDEAYEYIVYDGSRHVSPLALGGEHVIGIHSFSKTYAMTGWRLGYTVSRNDKVNRLLTLGNFAQTAGVTTFLQHAAAAALNDTETGAESIRGMVMEYRKRRDLLYEGLSAINGIRLAKPGGAFYLFPDCSELIPDQCTGDERETYIFRRLLDHGVAVVPGKSFGTGCEEYVRLAYSCTPLPAIETALKRIRTALG
ncbi:MAG: aminotransferase class I/II-fold pyridoxal phosphate-dependent enzyme, partial [bacterium]|jgi:aspartate/methionine/tyrosine aminotransferase|nr:aminotransferase class I/II-fold pyridoxal phosphate-dependent enzyme [bacterium]